MIYREYDKDQLLNKIEVLEERIAELELENTRLKNPQHLEHRHAETSLNAAADLNPEFFLATKEKKFWKKLKKHNLTLSEFRDFMRTQAPTWDRAWDAQEQIKKWRVLAGVSKKDEDK